MDKQRTDRQNRSLHLMLTMLSDQLNEAGLDVKKTLRHDVDTPWNPILVKELIYRPVMKAMTGKDSTTKLSTKELDKIYDVLNRHLGEKFGIELVFPSWEKM